MDYWKNPTGQYITYGNWSDPSNWWNGSVPTSGDLVYDNGGYMVANSVTMTSNTVCLEYSQSTPVGLVMNSSVEDPHSVIFTGGANGVVSLTLNNSALDGWLYTYSGSAVVDIPTQTSGVNYGLMYVTSSGARAEQLVVATGQFSNGGWIVAGQGGNFGLIFGQNPAAEQFISNYGEIEADAGGMLNLYAQSVLGDRGLAFGGEVINYGQINAKGGAVWLNTDVYQVPQGSINITDNGALTLEGATTGGTVNIQSGMLTFGTDNGIGFIGAEKFNSTIAFTGQTAKLDFGSAVTETFDATNNALIVNLASNGQQIADLHLSGAYMAQDFSVSGSQVLFQGHIPTRV